MTKKEVDKILRDLEEVHELGCKARDLGTTAPLLIKLRRVNLAEVADRLRKSVTRIK